MSTELRSITAKHQAGDAERIRKAISDIECKRLTTDALYLLLYCHNQAAAIDRAFASPNVEQFPRGDGPERAA